MQLHTWAYIALSNYFDMDTMGDDGNILVWWGAWVSKTIIYQSTLIIEHN